MNHEEKHLRLVKDCPICSTEFEQGMDKFWNDRDYVWLAWCKKCGRHIAVIMGALQAELNPTKRINREGLSQEEISSQKYISHLGKGEINNEKRTRLE